MNEKLWMGLSKVNGIGIDKLIEMDQASISMDDIAAEKFRLIVGEAIYQKVNSPGYFAGVMDEVEKEYRVCRDKQIDIIPYIHDEYPESLKAIDAPPLALYCKGNLAALNAPKKVAVIGNRDATAVGVKVAAKIASQFVEMGYVIVSGLAKGIDTAGHTGALEANGITIAVLPGNLEEIIPKSNRELAERIIENKGLLVSEYPVGQDFHKQNFMEYCRIQSGLSLGVCLVQAGVNGGSMHTVRFAASQGKLVLCPRPLEDENLPQYRGVVQLLSEKRAILLPEGDYSSIDALLSMRGNH